MDKNHFPVKCYDLADAGKVNDHYERENDADPDVHDVEITGMFPVIGQKTLVHVHSPGKRINILQKVKLCIYFITSEFVSVLCLPTQSNQS